MRLVVRPKTGLIRDGLDEDQGIAAAQLRVLLGLAFVALAWLLRSISEALEPMGFPRHKDRCMHPVYLV